MTETKTYPPVLDACCGGRMMWFDKADPRCLYVDKRSETVSRTPGAQAKAYAPLEVRPDLQADFTDLPFPSDTFALVVMDPPHIEKMGATSYLAKEYGKLLPDWRDTLRAGFAECFRVLRPEGVLVFKWCEYEIPVGEVLALTDAKPLFGHKTGKKQLTHWIAFLKPNDPICVTKAGKHSAKKPLTDRGA